MGQKSNNWGACSIENGSIVKNDLGSNQYTGHLGDVVTNLVVIDELAVDTF